MPVTLTITPIAVSENVEQLKVADLSVGAEVGCTFEFQNAELYEIFDIVGSEIFLKEGVTLDFETAQSSIQINVIQNNAVAGSEVFTPIVIDENDLPTPVTISAATVAEGAMGGEVVGVLMSTDQDALDTLSFRMVDGANNDLPNGDELFEIVVTNGVAELKVKAGVTLTDADVGPHE